jgi:hypothetical protein
MHVWCMCTARVRRRRWRGRRQGLRLTERERVQAVLARFRPVHHAVTHIDIPQTRICNQEAQTTPSIVGALDALVGIVVLRTTEPINAGVKRTLRHDVRIRKA